MTAGTVRIWDAYAEGRRQLEAAGVPEAGLDAWYLLEYVTGISRASFYADPDRKMTSDWQKEYARAITRRAERVPLQHITGIQEFMGLPFRVSEDVLIPRQDTETLVEEALNLLKEESGSGPWRACSGGGRILDLCTGSGCILLSVLHYAGTKGNGAAPEGVGADLSAKALETAAGNAGMLGIRAEFVQGDLFEHVEGKFQMILSNPPYIRSAEIEKLQEEVRIHDPREALDGGADGLYFYRRITDEAGAYLVPGGHLLFEIGYDQAEDVCGIMQKAGYTGIRVKKDLAGLDRVVCGVYSGEELSGSASQK